MNSRLILSALAAFTAFCVMPGTTRAQIFVTDLNGDDFNTGTVGEYTTSGVTVNPALITGLSFPEGIAVSRGNLLVGNFDSIGEYTSSGAAVNPALIGARSGPRAMAVS